MVAVVTGASDGIGLRTARLLAKRGYTVYGIADEEKTFPWMEYIQADVSAKGKLDRALASVYKKEPGGIDLLVCSAGYTLASPAYATTPADARHLYDVNFWGCVNAAAYVVPKMKEQGRGYILFVSSMSGVLPMPYLGFYTSSKAALNNWAAALYNEVKPLGIHVTVVLPGGVRTRFSFKRKKYTGLLEDETVPGLGRSIAAIYAIEQGGYSPERIAAAIVQAAESEDPPALLPCGTAMQVAAGIERLLPSRALLATIGKVFIGGAAKEVPQK